MQRNVSAVQLSATGLVTAQRAYVLKVTVFHTGGGDAELKFYDLDAAPVGGEPYYHYYVYGKDIQSEDMPEPGILFEKGIYVDLPTDCKCTVFYNEA